MIHLPRAASAAPTQKPEPKLESKSRSNRHSTHAMPPPPPYSLPAPPYQVRNQYNNCTFNHSNDHSCRTSYHYSDHSSRASHHHQGVQEVNGQTRPNLDVVCPFTSCTPWCHCCNHRPSASTRTKSRSHAPSNHSSPSHSTELTPRPANGAVEASGRSRRSHPSKEKSVRFTEGASVREKEPKNWDPAGGHRTNHASKSERRPEARKVERLVCDDCQEGSQRWLDGQTGRNVCDGCYRFKEGKRAARR